RALPAVLPHLRDRLLRPPRLRPHRRAGRRGGRVLAAAAQRRRGCGGVPRPRARQAEHARQHPDAEGALMPRHSAAVYRRRRLTVLLGLLVVVAAIGAGVWLILQQGGSAPDPADTPTSSASPSSADPSPEPSTADTPGEARPETP